MVQFPNVGNNSKYSHDKKYSINSTKKSCSILLSETMYLQKSQY